MFFVSNFVGREMLAHWAHLVSWRLKLVNMNLSYTMFCQSLTCGFINHQHWQLCWSVFQSLNLFDKIYVQTPADKRDTLCCYFSSRLVYFQVECQLDILPQFQVSILTNFLHFKISNLKITKQIQSVLLCCWGCCLETIWYLNFSLHIQTLVHISSSNLLPKLCTDLTKICWILLIFFSFKNMKLGEQH